jgi:pyridoxine 5-phosphate synthase
VDHVATVREARGGDNPDPVRAAILAQSAGADGITAHLREDRRHISDDDIARLSKALKIPLNLEMAATEEMAAIALKHLPHAACIVPEKREERTTEGGIDAAGQHNRLKPIVAALGAARIRVSMFIEPDRSQLDASRSLGAPVVELHTGAYANASGAERDALLEKLREAAAYGQSIGLEIHAGHGLTYENVKPVAAILQVRELNIGHFLMGEAMFIGLEASIREMRRLMNEARSAGDDRTPTERSSGPFRAPNAASTSERPEEPRS